MKNNIEEIYEKSKINSVGLEKKEKFSRKIKKILTSTGAILIAITSGVSLCACSSNNDKKFDPVITKRLANGSSVTAEKIFKQYGLNKEMKLSIEDYKKIPEIEDENLISFYEYLGEEEANKIAIALGYNSLNDFLIKNDYINSEGNPSISAWEDQFVNGKTR